MRRALLSFVLLAAAGPAVGQDRVETERRLTGLQAQIAGVEEQVRRARSEESSALRAVESIDAEIQLREQLVSGYQTQVGTIERETTTLRRSIERLETEIEQAKRSYRQRARHAYIHGRRNGLALILSAGSVTQMLVRARYLQQFAQRRRGQVERIAFKSSEMRVREQTVRQSLEETQRLIQQGQAERNQLSSRRLERATMVDNLRTRRSRLERELRQRRRDASALQGVVRELVAEERRRAAAAEAEAREAEAQRIAREEAERAAREARAAELERQRAEAARLAEEERAREAQRRANIAAQRAREAEQFRRRPTPRGEDPEVLAQRQREAERQAEIQREEARQQEIARQQAEAAAEAERQREEAAATRLAEAERREETARRAEAAAAAEAPESRAENLTGSFRQNRGRLPWPADGTITGSFGTRRDPVSGTQIDSPGIDISTAPAAGVRSVFAGTVQRVGAIPTYGTYVMVTHGEFVTLYGNLSGVSVRQGQSVRAGQALGRSGTAGERRGSSLFFALYQNGAPSNPVSWLRGR
ncbi:MAG: peptidoglycan DD-metalloendopeptidase family protein [Bacteroidota bacterium]